MKIFSSQFWGTVLIWAGVILFIAVIYDTVRPYFPSHSPYPWVRKLHSALSMRPAERGASTVQKNTKFHPRRPPPLPERMRRDGFLTTNIYQTQGDYHLWVWAIQPEKKTGSTVRVEIAHAAAGQEGGLWIVAYADTDGDGNPDREIARSGYLTSEKPGQWSSFEFKTGEKNIYVGATWPPGSKIWVYRDSGPWPASGYPFESLGGRYDPLFYHTISPGKASSAGPAITNIKVNFSD